MYTKNRSDTMRISSGKEIYGNLFPVVCGEEVFTVHASVLLFQFHINHELLKADSS
jgi:hypothetical protein